MAPRRRWPVRACRKCGQMVSTNALAKAAHARGDKCARTAAEQAEADRKRREARDAHLTAEIAKVRGDAP